MYKYYHRSKHMYFSDKEIIHLSKFSPSETYGWSPILTIFEKALTLVGMDKNLYRYFFERKMPASMLMVTTDDPESLRREREHIAAQTRLDPNYIPMVAVSARNQRGRVDLVRLFHTLNEMDYLPVREEVRERVAAMWGVTPAWQGAPEAFGGLSTQTQQLVVMSRVVEGDQRLFMEKVFPQLLDAFGITDYTINLPTPEEKSENTRLSFAQQKIQIVNQFSQLGFEVKLKEQDVPLHEVEFVISGKPTPMAQMQAEQMAMGIQQQQEQMEQMKEQQEQEQAMQEQMAEEGEEMPEEGMMPAEGEAIQAMLKAYKPPSQRKFKGRTGGVTPDWHDKSPDEERDIDEYAEARSKKNELTLSKSWIESLNDKGYTSPLIKEVTPDMSQMWFSQGGIDYVAMLSPTGVTHVEKATFSDPTRYSRVQQEKPKATKPTEIEIDD
jgi:DNA-binding transcriptional MerR regulator